MDSVQFMDSVPGFPLSLLLAPRLQP